MRVYKFSYKNIRICIFIILITNITLVEEHNEKRKNENYWQKRT